MPQKIRDAKDVLDTLAEYRKEIRDLRARSRLLLRTARKVARFDPVQVEQAIDSLLSLYDQITDLDDSIDTLIRDRLVPMLERRTKGEERDERDAAAAITELEKRLAAVERLVGPPAAGQHLRQVK